MLERQYGETQSADSIIAEWIMAQAHGEFGFLALGLVLLTAAVLSVPIARRLGLSAIVAYLVAGIIIGPYGIAAFGTPESIVPVSELGVVMLLFLIGLELELGKLVAMRRAIFGLGAAQLAMTALVIGALAYTSGLLGWRGAVVAGLALAMSATAIALQILDERGQLQQDYGQRAFAILLFQDMAVVPLLAILPLLAPGADSTPTGFVDELRPWRGSWAPSRSSSWPANICSIRSSGCWRRPTRAK